MGREFGGARRTLLGQLLHCPEGIEQEMRLDLSMEQPQPGLAQLAGQPFLFGFLLQLHGKQGVVPAAHQRQHEARQRDQQQNTKPGHHQDPRHDLEQAFPGIALEHHNQASAEQASQHAQADALHYELAATLYIFLVVEPDPGQRQHDTQADRIRGQHRCHQGQPGQEGQLDQCTEHREYQAQLGKQAYEGLAAIRRRDVIQLLALDRRHVGNLARHPAPPARRRLGSQSRLSQHAEQLLVPLLPPPRDSSPHGFLRTR